MRPTSPQQHGADDLGWLVIWVFLFLIGCRTAPACPERGARGTGAHLELGSDIGISWYPVAAGGQE